MTCTYKFRYAPLELFLLFLRGCGIFFALQQMHVLQRKNSRTMLSQQQSTHYFACNFFFLSCEVKSKCLLLIYSFFFQYSFKNMIKLESFLQLQTRNFFKRMFHVSRCFCGLPRLSSGRCLQLLDFAVLYSTSSAPDIAQTSCVVEVPGRVFCVSSIAGVNGKGSSISDGIAVIGRALIVAATSDIRVTNNSWVSCRAPNSKSMASRMRRMVPI